jgi:peptidoglycan hydrolase-like protein with peptidoglycan-binding domain
MQRQPAHRKSAARRWPVALAVSAALLVVGGGATGAIWIARSGSPATPSATNHKPKTLPFAVLATTPTASDGVVSPATTITVSFSSAISPSSPMPTLSPPISGAWSLVSPTEVEFVPSAPMVPGATEAVTVPGGATGMVSAQGVYLASSMNVPFSVAPGSTLRLQQLLAELGYLPLTFTPTTPTTSLTQEADVQQGTFGWRWPNQPASLTSLWAPGQMNVLTKGAIMEFENVHGLTTDGIAGPQVWADLLADASTGHADPNPWDYVYVSETQPETVTVYSNGAPVYHTLANTGIPQAPTAQGTFTVYLRYVSTTMSGTNPDGSHYSDPGVPWVSYFNGGDALHGFIRPGYGYPQSLGCVEMPPANAAVVYPLTPLGTLVTVGN